MLLLRILGRWGGELDLIKQVVKAHVLPAVLPLVWTRQRFFFRGTPKIF
jgi:hypothetical protein